MSRCLVTGHAGFIGSHLARRLIDSGHQVFGIDDLSGGFQHNIHPAVTSIIFDLRQNPDEIISSIKPEIVFHLAANAAENKAQFSPIDITSRNYGTFINTLVASLKAGMKRIVFTSSIAVYGQLQTPFKETDKPEPEDLYGVSKLAIEKSIEILSRVHGFEYVIARPHNVYGPQQNMADPYRNVVTLFMNSILNNQPYTIYGDGQQQRCFSYIDDVIDALYRCGFDNVSGKIFNIGSDNSYTINELSQAVMKVTGFDKKPIHLADRPQEVKIAISDHTLAKKHLGYSDKTSLQEGIKKTWEYAKSLGHQKPHFTEIELPSEKMPQNWKKQS